MSATLADLTTAAAEFRMAVGQVMRRWRAESQNAALARLERTGGATTADLARAEAVKPQSMGAILAALEQDGLVVRRPHPTDGRQVLFSLTERGAEARRRRDLAKTDWLLAALARLDPAEQQTLISATALIRRLGEA